MHGCCAGLGRVLGISAVNRLSRTRAVTSMMFFSVLALLSFMQLQAHAATPVEGDADLLQLLIEAQETNRAQFRRGKLTARAVEKVQNIETEATIVWDGERTCWTYYRLITAAAPRAGEKGPRVLEREGSMIYANGRLMCYWPKPGLAQMIADKSTTYESILKLRPDQIWFTMEGRYDWRDVLVPQTTADNLLKISVRREGSDGVVVEQHYRNGNILRYVASLRQGANIISYEKVFGSGREGSWRTGEYEWEQDRRGNWYLKHCEWKWSSRGDPEILDLDYVLDVLEFDPDPVIPPERFEFASLKLASGTTVEARSGGKSRTYRVGRGGKEQEKVSVENLNELAEKLKAGGFAAPMRSDN